MDAALSHESWGQTVLTEVELAGFSERATELLAAHGFEPWEEPKGFGQG